jgi:dTDP-4-dehydrorhamnose 3,5-epimerase
MSIDYLLTPLKIIDVEGGNVLHAIKTSDPGFKDFGEAYFSIVETGAIKAWKRHRSMTLNLVVPVGEVRFVMCSSIEKEVPVFQEVVLSKANYYRLTVPPMIWLGFQGLSSEPSMLLNVSDIPHDPKESDRVNREQVQFDWGVSK